jgi:hypothetical protein
MYREIRAQMSTDNASTDAASMAGPQSTQAPTVPAAAPTRRGKLLAKSKDSRHNKLTILQECVLLRSCKKKPRCVQLSRGIAH